MTIEFDSIALEIYNGSWVNVWGDVMHDPHPVWNRGIMGNGPTDRVGSPGIFTFALNNSESNSVGISGYYSPGHQLCWSGFTAGLLVRLSFVMDGITYYKYYGRIKPDGIQIETGVYGKRYTSVTCGDFFWRASQHELKTLTFAENKNIGELVTLVNANMPIPPLATDISVGVETFPSIFDMVYLRTTALGEYSKAAMSEWAYIYAIGDRISGETIVVENQTTRTNQSLTTITTYMGANYNLLMEDGSNLLLEDGYKLLLDVTTSINTPSYISKAGYESGLILMEDSSYLLLETGDKLIIDEVQLAEFNDLQANNGVEVSYGKNMANRINVTVYPRRIDTAATTVLFSLQKSFMVDANETLQNYRGAYRDPSNQSINVSGTEMVTPVAGTDYIATANEDGTGGTVTANLTITATYGTGEVFYDLQNTSGTALWVQTLQARGKGIYTYDTIQSVKNNVDSQLINGIFPLSLDFKYIVDARKAKGFADYVLLRDAYPRNKITNYPIWANVDSVRLFGFLQLEPGSIAVFKETQSGIDANHFINGYTAEIFDGKYVLWSPILNDDPGYVTN